MALAVMLVFLLLPGVSLGKEVSLLNVSYDPTREFFHAFNASFARQWQARTGETLSVKTSHGGSGKQARSVIDGLPADVVSLALSHDIDEIALRGKHLSPDWQKQFPQGSSPFSSLVVFLVRKGNPKGIKDWEDLVKPGLKVITPNPKTSGGARLNYLAAWGYAREKWGSDARAQAYMGQLLANVPVLDAGARGSVTTFVERQMGDVLLTWENEAMLALKEAGSARVEVVYPSVSILAQPPVAMIDKVVDKRGTRAVAKAYIEALYAPEGQELAAQHFYRPTDPAVAARHSKRFPAIRLFTVQAMFGSWQQAHKQHFADGGTFDQVYGRR
jgi:sulfate/thiosulfate-binding protein